MRKPDPQETPKWWGGWQNQGSAKPLVSINQTEIVFFKFPSAGCDWRFRSVCRFFFGGGGGGKTPKTAVVAFGFSFSRPSKWPKSKTDPHGNPQIPGWARKKVASSSPRLNSGGLSLVSSPEWGVPGKKNRSAQPANTDREKPAGPKPKNKAAAESRWNRSLSHTIRAFCLPQQRHRATKRSTQLGFPLGPPVQTGGPVIQQKSPTPPQLGAFGALSSPPRGGDSWLSSTERLTHPNEQLTALAEAPSRERAEGGRKKKPRPKKRSGLRRRRCGGAQFGGFCRFFALFDSLFFSP